MKKSNLEHNMNIKMVLYDTICNNTRKIKVYIKRFCFIFAGLASDKPICSLEQYGTVQNMSQDTWQHGTACS